MNCTYHLASLIVNYSKPNSQHLSFTGNNFVMRPYTLRDRDTLQQTIQVFMFICIIDRFDLKLLSYMCIVKRCHEY